MFQPNTDRLRDFEERAVNAACIFSLLKQRADRVPESEMRVKVSDIEKMFHRAIQGKDIKRRIRQKILLPVRPPGSRRRADDLYDDDADEFELNPTYRFEDDLMLHRMCPPEDVVAYESMRAALARLQAGRDERGAARIRRLAGTSQTQALQAFQATLRGATPAQRRVSRTSSSCSRCSRGRRPRSSSPPSAGSAVLHLDASRTPAREDRASFTTTSAGSPRRTRRARADAAAKVKPGTVTGTDADLRKLTMPQTERILTGFGVPLAPDQEIPAPLETHRVDPRALRRGDRGSATPRTSACRRFARSLRVGIAAADARSRTTKPRTRSYDRDA